MGPIGKLVKTSLLRRPYGRMFSERFHMLYLTVIHFDLGALFSAIGHLLVAYSGVASGG